MKGTGTYFWSGLLTQVSVEWDVGGLSELLTYAFPYGELNYGRDLAKSMLEMYLPKNSEPHTCHV